MMTEHYTRADCERMLEQAACAGARKALAQVGLADKQAADDIRSLRDLVQAIKTAQNVFLRTLVRWVTIGILVLILSGIFSRFELLK